MAGVNDWVPYQEQRKLKDSEDLAAILAKQSEHAADLGKVTLLDKLKAQRDSEEANRKSELFDKLRAQNPNVSVSVPDYASVGTKEGLADSIGKAMQMQQMKQNMENQQKLKDAQIPGMQITDPNKIPSQHDSESVKESLEGLSGIQSNSVPLRKELESASWKENLLPTEKARTIDQYVSNMALQFKQLDKLGVLSESDKKIIDEKMGALTKATGLRGLFMNKGEYTDALDRVLEGAKAKMAAGAKTRGYSVSDPGLMPKDMSGAPSIVTKDYDKMSDAELLQELKKKGLHK